MRENTYICKPITDKRQMKRFGSSIRYLTVDLISIFKTSSPDDFIEKRDSYLTSEHEPADSYYYLMDYERMAKTVDFIEKYLDSVTCENEMKMEIYFRQDQPAFIDDEVNTALFNFTYADKIYQFALENGLDMRIHTILWYWHVPRQLKEYLENRTAEDQRRLALDFIRRYMECLRERYPKAYCVDVINEMAADPDEIRINEEEGLPTYEFDDEGIRIDYWYKVLGKHYYIEVFRLAREVFGDEVKLFYNDNNEGNKEKQKTYQTVIRQIRQYEQEHHIRLIDGFGMQCHFWGSAVENRAFIEDMFSFYTKLDVELQITEFDVCNHSTKEIQSSIFCDFIDIAPRYGIEVFTTWGLNDVLSWYGQDEASLVDSNGDFKSFTQKYIEAFSAKYL